MGVHGLWKTVLRDYGQSLYNFVEVIDFGATLLVDASSFLFHLLNQQIPTIYKRYSFPRECGGCYRLIDEVIRLEIKRLRQKLGFGRVIFYFDGPVSYYKQDTKEKRRKQIQQQWEVIYELSVGLARSSDVSPSQLPLPPLAFRVLNTVLKELNVSIVSCPAEADQQMAIDCQRLNQSQLDGKTIAYCYSSDSDYLIMKDIPLIALGSLDDEDALSLHLKQQRSSSQLSIAVVVWRRSNIAKLYSCSEDMLVKWAILIGNDYTRGFEKSKFHPSLSDDKFLAYNDLLDWLKDHDDDNAGGEDEAEMPFRISKIADYRLRRTCEYSYLFYELEDVSPLCTEDSKTASDMLEGSEFDDGILLLPSHRESIETWLLQKQASNKLREETLASLTVTFLQDYVVRNRNQKQAPAGSSSVEDLNKDLGSIFSVDHIDVIVEMIDQLIQNALNPLKFSLSLLPTARTLLIQWEDVLAGNFFQLVAKEIDRAYYQLTAKTQSLPFQPSFLYDGLLFHHLLQKKRMTQDQTETGASNASVTENVPVDKEKKDVLPIDEYREEILARIDRSRVVVLSGETGCGKSTRVPIFIYEQAKEQKKKCRIIICQPRRIACVNLKNRLQEKFGDKVGLRMGHGVREESAKTQIFFVTSGYLVRLLAHHPHSLDSITHLIIDEVHERSVDNDLLCYLIKRNISHYKKLHLILMSATVQTTLYQDYFNDTPNIEDDLIVEDAISVGVRRFPVETVYVEGVMKAIGAKDQRLAKNCEVIVENCQRALDLTNQGNPQGSMVPLNLAKAQYDVCVALIHKVGKGGSGILIFVSGMSDILELQSRFEVPGGGSGIYKVIGIHSEIPFEDQLEALQPPQSGEIKIIIATNAAESSVTLPNVDVVICLGTHKAVSLQASNTASNKKKDIERSVLTNVWISKSSAIQRAGRTGRIRPGKVYRLYSEELYEKAFIAHESAEIHRKPLYEVIITLKCIFEDDPSTTSSSASLKQNGKGKGGKTALLPPITTMRDILENLIESVSPDLIDAALSFLYYQQILTSPSDTADSKLTSLGLFTAQSSTDLTLSKLMIYGITLGVGIESIIIAAALSQPKTVFRIAHPSIHKDPDEFNSIIAQTFLASVILDDGSYSDALMMVRLFVVWHYLTVEEAKAVMNKYGIVNARIRHFISSVKHLVRRCSESNGALRECLDVDAFLQNSYSTSSLKENYDVGEQVDDGGEPELTGRFVPKGTESSKRRKHLNWRNFKEKDIDVKLEEYVKRVVLSEETVMKIRLILLWTFNHNLLTSVPNGSELGEDNTEQHRCLEIKKDNALPIQDVLKYFPSTAFSLPPLKEFSGKDSANTTKVILTGKYHYSFELKTSFQTITSSEHTRRSLHELLVAKMISLWRQSQIDAAQPVVLVDSPSDKAGTKFDIPEENNESAKSDNKKNKDAKKKKKGDQKESSSSDDLKAEEKISSKGNKSKMGEKQNKSQIKTTEDPNPSQLFDTVDFLQHVTQITMQEVVEETKPKEKNKKGKKSSTSASSCVYSLSIAVFLNYRDTHQLELSRPLIQSLILLLQRYEPEVRTEPIFFSKQSDDSEDGTICYFNIKKFTISTAEMNQLYQYLLGFSGIIQVLSQGKVNETSSNSKGSSMNESLFPTSSKISVVNWKPSRTFLINYLTQLDSRTLWSEDQNFHHTYKRVKEEDVKYKIFFPQHVAPPSDSFVDEKFCDYSDYLRLFNAYALGNKERKMKVTIASTDETTDIKGGEGNKKAVLIVPGSVAWKQQKESEKKAQVEEETFPKVSAFNKEIREIPIKAKTSSWKIIGQLHQGDDEVVLSDLEGNIVDLTKVPWHQANISGRGPISTSWLHVEREIFDSHNGEVVKKVKETVYGVCYSATVSVSTVTGKERIMCEGVTLFPSRDWTRWALLCSGYMIGLKSFESEDDEATILRKIIICREVFELLQSLKNYRVEKKETIITLLDELFH